MRALREWHEGYDELEAIPNSFAVELEDDAPCLFFADSAEDKVRRSGHRLVACFHRLLTSRPGNSIGTSEPSSWSIKISRLLDMFYFIFLDLWMRTSRPMRCSLISI